MYKRQAAITDFRRMRYGSEPLDWTTTTVTLKGCIFTEDCLESQQDATNITHAFDLNPFAIQIGSGDTI